MEEINVVNPHEESKKAEEPIHAFIFWFFSISGMIEGILSYFIVLGIPNNNDINWSEFGFKNDWSS